MCVICWGDASRIGVYGDWDDLDCPGCGRYRVSRKFLQGIVGATFDVEQMRQKIGYLQAAGHLPFVNHHNACLAGKYTTFKTRARMPGWPAEKP
jgi:hypothetical protein